MRNTSNHFPTQIVSTNNAYFNEVALHHSNAGIEQAYDCDVHQSNVSRVLANVIEMLHVCLKVFIVWPKQIVLRQTLLMQFLKSYPNAVVFLDHFEIFIDRPSDLLARAVMYLSYKHHKHTHLIIFQAYSSYKHDMFE